MKRAKKEPGISRPSLDEISWTLADPRADLPGELNEADDPEKDCCFWKIQPETLKLKVCTVLVYKIFYF